MASLLSKSPCLAIVFVSLLVGLAGGCGNKSGPERAVVSGKVTLDGVPVESGAISFAPTGETQGLTAGGTITGGEYKLDAERGPIIGTHKVRINAGKKTGRQVQAAMSAPGTMTDEVVEAVPARFNSQTTLTREVKSGENKLDFELTSK